MKNNQLNYKVLYQQTLLGELKLFLHPKEFTLLKLRYAPKQELMTLWSDLWEGIKDYDDLPVGCRTLMPTVVSRIQSMLSEEDWMRVHGLNLTFLTGLPRFVWTKNKFMFNQMLRIAEHVGKSGIEIIALKGMAELLLDSEFGKMRSSSDMDLLIKADDFQTFKQKMLEIGYEPVYYLERTLAERSPLPKDQYIFQTKSGYKLQIDVHLMVDKYNSNDRLTELVWLGKVPSKKCPTLFIPSPRDRYLISLVNGFRLTNWYYGSYLKYLSDALSEFYNINQIENQNDIQIHFLSLSSQNWHEQILQIGREIGLFDETFIKTYGLSPVLDSDLKPRPNAKISLKSRIPSIVTRRLSLKSNLYLVTLLKLYSQVWQYMGKKGEKMKAIKFLLLDPFIQLMLFIERKANVIYFWKDKDSVAKKKLPITPTSNLKWN